MISIPTQCPCCSSTLERVKDQIFCRNDSCDAKTGKQVQHFTKTMKIMGMGEKTIEKLELTNICHIYMHTKETLEEKLSSEKLADKLYNQIQASRLIPIETYIASFGIPLIGKSIAESLGKFTDSIWNIDKKVCENAGLGTKAMDSLLQWIVDNKDRYSQLPIKELTTDKPSIDIKLNVCITGKLDDYSSRAKAKSYLESFGIKVLSGVSSKVEYLISEVEGSTSSSVTKATKLGIPIITIKDLLKTIK